MNNPKKGSTVVFVRHGDAGLSQDKLTDIGKRQVSYVAHEIKRLFSYENPVVVTSDKQRAKESAVILEAALVARQYTLDCLSVKSNTGLLPIDQIDYAATMVLEYSKLSDLLVVVTHSELITALAMLFVNQKYDCYCTVSTADHIKHGEGFYYNEERKGFVHIRQRIGI